MRVSVAQIRAIKGDIEKNLQHHLRFVRKAIEHKLDIIVFPELSLTGYEPLLAGKLAADLADSRFDIIQKYSDENEISIGVGMPTKNEGKLFISMVIFQPVKERTVYSKQFLFPTEKEVFSPGEHSVYIEMSGRSILSPAICYEISNPEHSKKAKENKAGIYVASVLNSISGVDGDLQKLAEIAQKHQMIVLMSNYVGESGGYQCAGKTSVWNKKGELLKQMDDKTEGLLIYDTLSEEVFEVGL